MTGDIAVGVTIGATVGAAYRRAFLDAKTRLKNLGDAFEEANKRLTAAGAVRFPRPRGDRGTGEDIGALPEPVPPHTQG